MKIYLVLFKDSNNHLKDLVITASTKKLVNEALLQINPNAHAIKITEMGKA